MQRLGAIFSKGTTLRPRRGAPPPRVVETPAGMLNAVGLQNPGVDAVVSREKAPQWARWDVPVSSMWRARRSMSTWPWPQALDSVPGVAAIELNISCPNVAAGGMIFGCDPEMAAEVTREVRAACSLPLIVKLTPNVADIRPIAAAVEEAGADAMTLVNTLLGMAIDIRGRKPYLGNVTGGLSGPAIKPVAVRMVYQAAQTVCIPIVGAGGASPGGGRAGVPDGRGDRRAGGHGQLRRSDGLTTSLLDELGAGSTGRAWPTSARSSGRVARSLTIRSSR